MLLAGDAAGVVAPSSGEGIYYAMIGGRVAATAAAAKLKTGRIKDLQLARKLFLREQRAGVPGAGRDAAGILPQ